MRRPSKLIHKSLNWPAYNKTLKCRGSLTIWLDPEMVWAALPTGKRWQQPFNSDVSVQTCLTMRVLSGTALRQTAGFAESLLRLIGLGWAVPHVSALSRRQTSLKVNVPYRGSQAPCTC